MLHWRWLLIFFALTFGVEQSFAASARENRDYDAAVKAFQDGIWNRAETELAQFVQTYPKSDHLAEALLLQAEAEFQQGKFAQAIALLQTDQANADKLADQYVFWIGQSQFSISNYPAATEAFSSLAQNFTNSPLRLDAIVNEAAARAKMLEWPQIIELLENTNGVFQHIARIMPADERVMRGQLLLAEALLKENRAGAAAAVLQALAAEPLKPALDWQRTYLLCRIQLAENDDSGALNSTTNLLRLANLENRDDWRAQSILEQASVLEQLGKNSEAMSAYRQNLSSNTPPEWQRQAMLKMADMALAQQQFTNAEESLADFLAQFPDAPAADVAVLTLGELHLKQAVGVKPPDTNQLSRAQARFDQFINTFTNSAMLGKAYLDRGWCYWIEEKWTESAADFKAAAEKLPPSVDLAVARFKLGDAQFRQNDLTGARENYEAVANDFTNFPVVNETLGAQALYQTLRVCLKLNDVLNASNALARILKIYPTSNLADKSVLLVGEGLADMQQPAAARALFQKAEGKYTNSDQLPEVELAIARTYEQEGDWPSAIHIYNQWIAGPFATNINLLPQVEYARAWANFQAGNETNAFLLFTNFIAQFPSNDLAPVAQWWVGDHFFGTGTNFLDAEKNYELVYQDWPDSSLAYPAKMMAGRAALARQGYSDAIGYFTKLTSDTNCPPDLYAQALAAYGGALMLAPSPDTNNPLTNFVQAVLVFKTITQFYPNSAQAALAEGEIGDCYFQLALQDTNDYDLATKAYAQVVASTNADITARSQAQVGIGRVIEERAALATGDSRKAMLESALQSYLNVFYGNILREGEQADPFWTEKAGLQAASIAETLGEWQQAINLYRRLEDLLPPLRDSLEKKIANAQAQLASGPK